MLLLKLRLVYDSMCSLVFFCFHSCRWFCHTTYSEWASLRWRKRHPCYATISVWRRGKQGGWGSNLHFFPFISVILKLLASYVVKYSHMTAFRWQGNEDVTADVRSGIFWQINSILFSCDLLLARCPILF